MVEITLTKLLELGFTPVISLIILALVSAGPKLFAWAKEWYSQRTAARTLSSFEIALEINRILAILVKQLGAKRASIIALHNGGGTLSPTGLMYYSIVNEQVAYGVEPLQSTVQRVPISEAQLERVIELGKEKMMVVPRDKTSSRTSDQMHLSGSTFIACTEIKVDAKQYLTLMIEGDDTLNSHQSRQTITEAANILRRY